MQSFLQSAFLQALGYAIANSLWQIAMLWLAVMIIKNIGKLSSSSKYFVAVTAQFAGFVWFICTLEYYYSKCKEALLQLSPGTSLNDHTYIFEPAINNFSSAVLYLTIKGEQYLPYLSLAYLCILLFLGVRLTRAFYFTQRIRTTGLQKPDIEWRLFVKKTAAYLGIKKDVKIYFSNLIKSPVTLGFLKPLILVPIASINHLTADQLEALLLHELAHIRRADYLINIFQSIIEIILFFNPFVQLLGKLIKKERENSCDDWVLQFQYNPTMYAEALLRIACSANPGFAMSAAGNKNDLLSRVKRMLNQQEKSYGYRNQVFALLLITIMLSTVAWFNPGVKYPSTSGNAKATQKIVVEPLAASADNPLFNPVYFFSKPIKEELDKAVSTVNDKIEATAPAVQKTTSQILTKVTPMVLEKLENLNIDIDTATINASIAQAKDEMQRVNQFRLQGAPSFNVDTTNLADVKKVLLDELNKTDWSAIGADIKKASAQILSTEKDKLSALTSDEIEGALKNSYAQLEKLKVDNLSLKNLIQTVTEKKQNIEFQNLQETEKKIEKQFKVRQFKQKMDQQKCSQQKTLNTYSDIDDENTFVQPEISTYTNVAGPNVSAYTPVLVNNSVTAENAPPAPQSAIIIVKHNPANDSSHTKHITVEIIGSNGVHKTYELTVEVYQ